MLDSQIGIYSRKNCCGTRGVREAEWDLEVRGKEVGGRGDWELGKGGESEWEKGGGMEGER